MVYIALKIVRETETDRDRQRQTEKDFQILNIFVVKPKHKPKQKPKDKLNNNMKTQTKQIKNLFEIYQRHQFHQS